eukprot:CAMPEP_0168396288 /NCGR_PEP_ID=MMETSP0228-20121227/20474_1 /TAXON_ID=133427 /ORGANISM="Protoceratium reticulatum, Strain CCCM 535 (=CCMP 1889)" /LENGTH=130 /DNA_ID=CAMNT_0008409731 /DNA_START=37 /DNA_END=426 /DNA_ORIENTATION=+
MAHRRQPAGPRRASPTDCKALLAGVGERHVIRLDALLAGVGSTLADMIPLVKRGPLVPEPSLPVLRTVKVLGNALDHRGPSAARAHSTAPTAAQPRTGPACRLLKALPASAGRSHPDPTALARHGLLAAA